MGVNAGLKENFELRAIARDKLRGKWLYAVLISLIAFIFLWFVYWIPFGSLVISGPVSLGLAIFFLNLRRDQNPLIENLFDGFNFFSRAFIMHLWICLFTFLWTLLFIIPGIIATFRYSMSFYILHDHPELKPKAALELSKQMMVGRKGKLFLLYLSFIGWGLLAMLTLGIGMLWVMPYVHASVASFYEDVKDAPLANGTLTATTAVQ
jgi:Predicted integral membrane protein